MSVKPTSFVLEHAPWSNSKADTAKQCPHRFYLQYIQKAERIANPAAVIGLTVHKALEYILTNRPVDKCFELAINEMKATTNEIDEIMGFKPAVRSFVGKLKNYREFHNAMPPVLEQQLNIDLEGRPLKFFDNSGFLRGVIDLSMLINGRPDALIIDHKTGKVKELSAYKIAFDMYMLLFKSKNPNIEKIGLGINFLREGTVQFVKGLQDVRNTEPIMDRVIRHLNSCTVETHKHKLVRPGPLCDWCDYRHICPAHADGANGKQRQEE